MSAWKGTFVFQKKNKKDKYKNCILSKHALPFIHKVHHMASFLFFFFFFFLNTAAWISLRIDLHVYTGESTGLLPQYAGWSMSEHWLLLFKMGTCQKHSFWWSYFTSRWISNSLLTTWLKVKSSIVLKPECVWSLHLWLMRPVKIKRQKHI